MCSDCRGKNLWVFSISFSFLCLLSRADGDSAKFSAFGECAEENANHGALPVSLNRTVVYALLKPVYAHHGGFSPTGNPFCSFT